MLFLRYAWVLLLANGYLNVCLARWRVKDTIASYPELADGYRRLTRGFGILYALPWVVMGLGCTVGGVPTVFHFLSSPVAAGPFVWAWWLNLYAELAWLAWWVVWGGGAEALVRYPGVIGGISSSVSFVRLKMFMVAVSAFTLNTWFLIYMT
jgi:hypothetical protein